MLEIKSSETKVVVSYLPANIQSIQLSQTRGISQHYLKIEGACDIDGNFDETPHDSNAKLLQYIKGAASVTIVLESTLQDAQLMVCLQRLWVALFQLQPYTTGNSFPMY